MKVNEIGEIGLIKRIGGILRSKYLGDDCAVLDVGAEYLVVTIDMLHRVTDFPREMTGEDIGWMSVAVSLSDVAAMGARPTRRRRGDGHTRRHGRSLRRRYRPGHGPMRPDVRHRDRGRRHRPAPGADHGNHCVRSGEKRCGQTAFQARSLATCYVSRDTWARRRQPIRCSSKAGPFRLQTDRC